MKVKTAYREYELSRMEIGKYYKGNNLAIKLYCIDEEFGFEELLAYITVNLPYGSLKENEAFVDTNNCPWAIDFIKEHELGEFTGIECSSGYCKYPLYRFNLKKVKELL
jgi:hypothetical protein